MTISFHGLPDPLNFPTGEVRRSIILYYYTKAPRPESDTSIKKTSFSLVEKKKLG